MARDAEIERRLLNWARWRVARGVGALGYAAVQLGEQVGTRAAYREARIPTSDCEAEETERAVQHLLPELRAAVVEVYTGSGVEADHMRELKCARSTMYLRIDRAHAALRLHFTLVEQARRAERSRVDALHGKPVHKHPLGLIERSFTP